MKLKELGLLTEWRASRKRISSVHRWAATDGVMFHYFTFCSNATGSHAWINTFLIVTCFIQRTVGANYTLRST